MAKTVKSVKEIDSWYDECKTNNAALSSLLEKSSKAIERLVKSEKNLAQSYADLAAKMADFGDVETNTQLSRYFMNN